MKKMTISHLSDGETITDFFAVTSCDKKTTRTNKPYLAVELADATGTISGRVWDDAEKLFSSLTAGTVARVTAKVESYQGSLQLNIIDARKTTAKDAIDPADYMPQSPHDTDLLLEQFMDMIHSISDASLRTLVTTVFSSDTLHMFRSHPAAKKMHHAYIGGLLEHTLSVTRLALTIAELYPYVNRDILCAGALVHDCGKIHEMASSITTEYTLRGCLTGHITIGCEMIARAADAVPALPKESLWHVEHLILSHHGQREFGSPVIPATVEAFILHHADMLDAQLFQAYTAISTDENNEDPFTPYVFGLDRRIMKPRTETPSASSTALSSAPVTPPKQKKTHDDLLNNAQEQETLL